MAWQDRRQPASLTGNRWACRPASSDSVRAWAESDIPGRDSGPMDAFDGFAGVLETIRWRYGCSGREGVQEDRRSWAIPCLSRVGPKAFWRSNFVRVSWSGARTDGAVTPRPLHNLSWTGSVLVASSGFLESASVDRLPHSRDAVRAGNGLLILSLSTDLGHEGV